eukprot:23275-Prorocentrum_minimum.AAC.1
MLTEISISRMTRLRTTTRSPTRRVCCAQCATLTTRSYLGPIVQGKPAQDTFPSQLFELPAARMSFWVAGMFSGAEEQQQLLEISTCRGRLEREKEILKGTLDYLTVSGPLPSQHARKVGDRSRPPLSSSPPPLSEPESRHKFQNKYWEFVHN